MAIQKTANNQPRTSRRSSTLAQPSMQQRPNVEKVGNTSQGIRPTQNMNVGIHTETTSKALCYADDIKSNLPVYSYQPEFRHISDGQDDRKAKGQTIIPEWQSMNETLQDPHAVNRTTVEMHPVEGFHKGPQFHQYSMEENFQESRGGVRDPISHRPTHSDANKVGSVSTR